MAVGGAAPTVNRETHGSGRFLIKRPVFFSVYRFDSSMDVDRAFSSLHYAEGDKGCWIMRLIFYLNHQDGALCGKTSAGPLEPISQAAHSYQADQSF